jgi:hypothetical protein
VSWSETWSLAHDKCYGTGVVGQAVAAATLPFLESGGVAPALQANHNFPHLNPLRAPPSRDPGADALVPGKGKLLVADYSLSACGKVVPKSFEA